MLAQLLSVMAPHLAANSHNARCHSRQAAVPRPAFQSTEGVASFLSPEQATGSTNVLKIKAAINRLGMGPLSHEQP
jgi:hypothetical protein